MQFNTHSLHLCSYLASSGLICLLSSYLTPAQVVMPAVAQVRQAFIAAHPTSFFTCPDGTPFVTLTSSHPAIACLVGDDELTLHDGRRTTTVALSPHAGSHRKFDVAADQLVGTYVVDTENQEEVTSFDILVSGARGATVLGNRGEAHFVTLDDSAVFNTALRRTLTGVQVASPLLGTLNDTGYLLQRAGYPRLALRILMAVIQRTPSRAVAYLNRGDAYWQLNQLAAAQADYRQYLTLVRARHKDTTRVPTYVRSALRLSL